MKLDLSKPHGLITGMPGIRYEQGGLLFDYSGVCTSEPEVKARAADLADRVVQTDLVESARMFLRNVLKNAPLSKAAIYKTAGENNQNWEAVKNAALLERIITYRFSTTEMWKLPEEVEV